MLKITMPIFGLMLLNAHQSAASDCDNDHALSASQIQTLLNPGSGVYACGHSDNDKWNETLKNGSDVWDYKLGNVPADPSTKVATYSISGPPSGAGTIHYNYGGSAQFTYKIAPASGTTYPNMGRYLFCQLSGVTYSVNITLGPGNC